MRRECVRSLSAVGVGGIAASLHRRDLAVLEISHDLPVLEIWRFRVIFLCETQGNCLLIPEILRENACFL